MPHRTLPTAWFVVFASLAAPSYAAAPEFKTALVTESRSYEREEVLRQGSAGASGVQPVRVWCQRVTVALESERITGESCNPAAPAEDWLAQDFPLGAHVQVAIKGNELRLIHPDAQCAHSRLSSAPCRKWSTAWVSARIVDRVRSEEDEDERD